MPGVGSSGFPKTGRDAETCRPVIAPSSMRWEEDEGDGTPSYFASKWTPLAVVLGALLGTLVVGWLYVQDHPPMDRFPLAARGTTALTGPPESTPAPFPPAASVAPQGDGKGFVAIGGPEGAHVFDGDTFVGTAPLLHATSAGAHVIRVDHAASGHSQSFTVEVRAYKATPVTVTFDTRSRARRRTKPPR